MNKDAKYRKRLSELGWGISHSGISNVMEFYVRNKRKFTHDDAFISHHLACLMFWDDVAKKRKRVL